MTWRIGEWPESLHMAMVALLVIAASYLVGRLARRIVRQRLGAIARRTRSDFDDAAVEAVARRVPFWSLLGGIYIAAGFWVPPGNLASVLNGALFVALAASLTLLTADALSRLARAYGPAIDPTFASTSLIENLVRIVVVIVGVLVVLNGLGLSITPILGALGVGGLAMALALQDTLANLFAGFYISLARQIRVGDYLRLDSGQEGYVVDIDWRATRLRMLANNIVLVPNAKLSQSIVTNFHLPDRELAVLVDVGVDYDSDLKNVERVTIEVAREVQTTVPGAVAAFEPFIRYHTFGESCINFAVILRGQEFVDQYLIKHEFVERLHRRYLAEGIVIPFPIRTIVSRSPSPPPEGIKPAPGP